MVQGSFKVKQGSVADKNLQKKIFAKVYSINSSGADCCFDKGLKRVMLSGETIKDLTGIRMKRHRFVCRFVCT